MAEGSHCFLRDGQRSGSTTLDSPYFGTQLVSTHWKLMLYLVGDAVFNPNNFIHGIADLPVVLTR